MQDKIKSSVRLPKTPFAMKANLNSLEEKLLKVWKDNNIYQKIQAKNQGKETFILHDGPPYANGNIHVGHAFNKILKDIILRSYLNLGYNTPFIPGWDCHGLPIEWKIEEKYKKKGIAKEEININYFREECRSFASHWVAIQKEEMESLGINGDFNKPYLTMDYDTEATIVSAIFEVLKKGLLYQGKKPVMWSCVEKTALAEAEVEYKDKVSETIYAGFKVHKSPNTIWQGAYVIIWTTTPWTLPANQAVAYGKDITYSLIEIKEIGEGSFAKIGQRIIVAQELYNEVCNNLKILKSEVLQQQEGLSGFELQHCLYGMGYDFTVPTLEGDFVDVSTGTGIVHMAPSHGEDDFYLCKKNGIVPKEYVLDNGQYIDDIPLFANDHVYKVAPKVIENLIENSTMFAHSKITHSYPHSWRSKAPLIYRLTTQWFISLDKNNTRKKALESLESIDFYPKTGKNRLKSMLENRPDWCVSRQRSWGVPLSLFVHRKTKEVLIDQQVFENIINAFKKDGSSSWFKGNPKQFLGEKYNHEDYDCVSDVVDVWMDSGLSNYYVLKNRKELSFPADLYLEGSDQHRGWFQSSLIMSLLLFDQPPYKKVLTHGFILDETSQKMSKSQGNGITPAQVVKEYGTDILRTWAASCNFMEDVSIGKGILNQQTDSYRKIRNTLRYLLANTASLTDKSLDLQVHKLEEIDLLILNSIYEIDILFEKTFKETFNLHLFFTKVLHFMQSELSAFYFDIKKDILYCDGDDSIRYLGTLSVLNILFNYLIKWLSPFIPFTCEEAFAAYYNQEIGELFLHNFSKASESWYNDKLSQKWDKIKKVRKVVTGAVEKARAKKEIGSSLESSPIIYVNADTKSILEALDFAEICITSNINIEDITKLNSEEKENLFSLNDVDNVFVKFQVSGGEKCSRCWRFVDELKDNLCHRCHEVLAKV